MLPVPHHDPHRYINVFPSLMNAESHGFMKYRDLLQVLSSLAASDGVSGIPLC